MGLRADLIKAGAMIDVVPRRCAALGWSAGGSSVIYLVSEAGIASGETSIFQFRSI
jgi:hypothetical protein